jgi:hypothetical protein
MAIQQTVTTSFKVELLQGVHNFGPTSPDAFWIALYTSEATINATTTTYSTGLVGQVANGNGYTTGGKLLTISQTPTSSNNNAYVPTAYISFATITWPNASFTARGALIYNITEGNKSVAVLDFGADKTVTNTTFTIAFPTADSNSAIVRIA